MIEQVKSERKNGEKQDVLFNMPKNVRQIGQASNERKIYVEDYVMSYVRYLGKEATEQFKIAILLGEVKDWEGSACIFISGALEVEGVQIEDCNCFPKEIWEGIYRLIEENFNKGSIVGWMVTKAGMLLEPSEWLEKIHIDNFAGQDKTLMLYDALEREEAFFLFDEKHLKKVPGYYIYYEKNHEMQNYMLQKKGTVEQEKVDDYAIVEMRKKMSEMEQKKKKQKRGRRYTQGAGLICATLAVAVLLQNEDIKTKFQDIVSEVSKETVSLQQEIGLEQFKKFIFTYTHISTARLCNFRSIRPFQQFPAVADIIDFHTNAESGITVDLFIDHACGFLGCQHQMDTQASTQPCHRGQFRHKFRFFFFEFGKFIRNNDQIRHRLIGATGAVQLLVFFNAVHSIVRQNLLPTPQFALQRNQRTVDIHADIRDLSYHMG